MQKQAEERLAARSPPAKAGAAGQPAGSHRKQAPLLYDMVHAGKAELCIKVGGGTGGRVRRSAGCMSTSSLRGSGSA